MEEGLVAVFVSVDVVVVLGGAGTEELLARQGGASRRKETRRSRRKARSLWRDILDVRRRDEKNVVGVWVGWSRSVYRGRREYG